MVIHAIVLCVVVSRLERVNGEGGGEVSMDIMKDDY